MEIWSGSLRAAGEGTEWDQLLLQLATYSCPCILGEGFWQVTLRPGSNAVACPASHQDTPPSWPPVS